MGKMQLQKLQSQSNLSGFYSHSHIYNLPHGLLRGKILKNQSLQCLFYPEKKKVCSVCVYLTKWKRRVKIEKERKALLECHFPIYTLKFSNLAHNISLSLSLFPHHSFPIFFCLYFAAPHISLSPPPLKDVCFVKQRKKIVFYSILPSFLQNVFHLHFTASLYK